MSKAVRAVIVPGNGSGDVTRANWYSWVNKVVKKLLSSPFVFLEDLKYRG